MTTIRGSFLSSPTAAKSAEVQFNKTIKHANCVDEFLLLLAWIAPIVTQRMSFILARTQNFAVENQFSIFHPSPEWRNILFKSSFGKEAESFSTFESFPMIYLPSLRTSRSWGRFLRIIFHLCEATTLIFNDNVVPLIFSSRFVFLCANIYDDFDNKQISLFPSFASLCFTLFLILHNIFPSLWFCSHYYRTTMRDTERGTVQRWWHKSPDR